MTSTPNLRRRVSLAVLALLTVVLVALFSFVDLTLSARLHSSLQGRLLDRAGFAKLLDGQVNDQQLVNELTGDGVTASLSTGAGPIVGVLTTGPKVPGPKPGRSRPPKPVDAAVVTRGDLLTVTTNLAGGQLTVTASQADIAATVRRLIVLELAGGLVALIVLTAALHFTIGLALRPLGKLTSLATAIASGSRGTRLRPQQPATDLGRTATAFDAMLDELETAVFDARAAEDRLRDFLSDASHELRTPVAGVSASAELLLTQELSTVAREQLAVGLVNQSRRISRLVEDLLLSARLAGPDTAIQFCDADLAVIVHAQLDQARLLSTDLNFVFHGPPPGDALLAADPVRLGQVLTNLLDNARQATPPGGRITVTIEHDGDLLVIKIMDTGLGVPIADRRRIFDRFVRLGQGGNGAGLGLAISRSIAEAHGGSLTYRDEGSGACFVVSLPALSSRILAAAIPACHGVS